MSNSYPITRGRSIISSGRPVASSDGFLGHDDLHGESVEETTLLSELMASLAPEIEIVSPERFDWKAEVHHSSSYPPHHSDDLLYLPSLSLEERIEGSAGVQVCF